MATAKERTNLYLNRELKQIAQEKLDSYGMNLSAFVNLMMAKLVQKDVDMLLPTETLDVIKDFEGSRKSFEKPIAVEDFIQELKK